MSSTQPRFPVSMRVALLGAQGSVAAEVTDVSAGGMFVRTDRVVPVGTLVSAALEIPDGADPAAVEAKVIHVAGRPPEARATRRGFGAQFVGGDERFRARMQGYIESIEHKSRVPVRLLLVARDLLYEHGWTQLAFRDPKGSYCLTSALADAAGNDRDAYRSALQTLGPRLGVRGCPYGGFDCHCALLAWNDVEGRSRRDVVAKLDEIIHTALGHGASA
jgi:Tfp pilus assembly protein PilZ